MLVLKRRRGQSVKIGLEITVQVVKIEAGAVSLSITAPAELIISREPEQQVEGQVVALDLPCSQRTDPR